MCTSTSSCSPYLRLGGIACFALAGSDFQLGGGICSAPAGFDLQQGGSPHATPAGFILGVGPGGLRGPALAGVASALPRSGKLGLQDPLGHRLLEHHGLCHYVHFVQRLRCRVRCYVLPGLEGLGRRKLGRIPGDDPGAR